MALRLPTYGCFMNRNGIEHPRQRGSHRLRILAALGVVIGAMTVSVASAWPATKQPTKKAVTTRTKPTTTVKAKSTTAPTGAKRTFKAEVWADNWFSMSVNGVIVGEDSVPITTERSFNAETFTFAATSPLTIAIEAKDFKQDDSGLEYIGKPNQQMGDGGVIVQVTDVASGKVVAATTAAWKTLVVHRAPLDTTCEKDAEPLKTCTFSSTPKPSNWTTPSFDDSAWEAATVWSEANVNPRGGYDEITWNQTAELVWGPDLHIDNTVLLRHTVR
jgi:hypothetical protein